MSDFFGAVPKVVEKLNRMEQLAETNNRLAEISNKLVGEIVVLLHAIVKLLEETTEIVDNE